MWKRLERRVLPCPSVRVNFSGIIGPDGAGKMSLFRILALMLSFADEGKATVPAGWIR